jgi:molecular chaperone DnaK
MIGIDLGTTKSRVAVMENGVPQLIPNQEGAYATPSIVGLTAKGFRLIGQIAERQAVTNPTNTVVGVKRIIGRKFDSPEVAQARHLLSCQLVRPANGDVHIQVGGQVYSPPEITSFVLQKLKAAAEDYLGAAVEGAVITVPTYFNDSQREATREAGIIADLEVMPFLDEPTAAALACGPNPAGQRGRFVAVYDLGGGTFSITILEMAEGVFQVRATDGDIFLGGQDFDRRIIGWLVAEFQRETEVDLMRDGETLQRVRDAAERAKCELSMAAQTEIVLPLVPGARRLRTVLSRQRYEDLTHDLIERTIEPSKRCLSKAGLKPEQIDMVLLVGGQTRAPKVSEIVRNVFDSPKEGKAKLIRLAPPALAVLSALPRIEGNSYILPGYRAGQPLVGMSHWWGRIRTQAGVPELRLHDLRHSWASIAAGSGTSLPIIGALLGHSQPQTTQRYAHLGADPLRSTADAVGARIASALDKDAEREGAVVIPLGRA